MHEFTMIQNPLHNLLILVLIQVKEIYTIPLKLKGVWMSIRTGTKSRYRGKGSTGEVLVQPIPTKVSSLSSLTQPQMQPAAATLAALSHHQSIARISTNQNSEWAMAAAFHSCCFEPTEGIGAESRYINILRLVSHW